MREFKSLQTTGLHLEFDATIHTEEPIVQFEQDNQHIKISYTFPGFYLSDISHKVDKKTVKFRTPHIQSVGNLMVSGKATLPSFGRYVQVPPKTKYTVKIETGEPVQFDDVLLAPAQVDVSDSVDQPVVFEYDRDFYESDNLYPENLVEVTGPLQVEDYNALLIHVRPLQYNAAKRQIIGFGNITITISLTPETDAPPAPYIPDKNDQRAYGNLFLNPKKEYDTRADDPTTTLLPEIVIKPPILFPIYLFNPQLLIVYADGLVEAAEKLMQWKNEKGLSTAIVPISKIGNDPEKLRKYIYSRRSRLLAALRYVLLLGDVDQIKPHTIQNSPWGANVTDYYFSVNKDIDPNTLGTNDLLDPWLSIGRIPMSTSAETLQVVDQIIAYEKTPPTDLSFYDRMLVAAYFQGGPNHQDTRGYLRTMETLAIAMEGLGYIVERVYVTDDPQAKYYDDGTLIPASVLAKITDNATATAHLIQATTQGQLIIGHRDHGEETGWYMPPFHILDLNQVTGTMPSVFFSINCLTGMFDRPAMGVPQQECFAEANLRLEGTAPSLIAATRVSHTGLNNYLETALYDAVFANIISTFPAGTASYPLKNNRLGDMLNYAKMYLPVVVSGIDNYIKDEREIYHVVGDPTLEVWVRDPLIIRMKLQLMARTRLLINLSSVPTGTYLTIWYDGKLLRGLEPTSVNTVITLPSSVVLPIPFLRTHSVRVCCYAPGARFVEASITIPVFISQPVQPGILHPIPPVLVP